MLRWETNMYMYYKLLDRRMRVRDITDRIEKIILDNVCRGSVLEGGGIGEDAEVVYGKMYDGRKLLVVMNDLYDRMKGFRAKLDSLLGSVRKTAELSRPVDRRVASAREVRNKYDAIIAKMRVTLGRDFVGSNGDGVMPRLDDVYLFSKSDVGWENIVAIYVHFIDRFRVLSQLDKLKLAGGVSVELDDVMGILNSELDSDIAAFDQFVDKLRGVRIELGDRIRDMRQLIGSEYNLADIKFGVFSGDIKWKDDIQFSDRTMFTIEPENISVFEAIFGSTVDSINGVNDRVKLDALNLSVPMINGRIVRGVQVSSDGKQNGGSDNLYKTVDRLVRFGMQVQDANILLGDTRKYYYTYSQLRVRANYYLLYLLFLQVGQTDGSKVSYYRYVNRAIVERYYRVIGEIDRLMSMGDTSPTVRYFNVYHWFTIKNMGYFMRFLLDSIGPNDIIDVYGCRGQVLNSFVVFNHFVSILDRVIDKFTNI